MISIILYFYYETIFCSSAPQLLPASWLIALVVLPNLARMVALSKDQSPSVLIPTSILSVQHTIINHSWNMLKMIKSAQWRVWMFTVSLINSNFNYSVSIENFYWRLGWAKDWHCRKIYIRRWGHNQLCRRRQPSTTIFMDQGRYISYWRTKP